MVQNTKSINGVFYRVSIRSVNNDGVFCEPNNRVVCKLFEKYFINNDLLNIVSYSIDKKKIDILIFQSNNGDVESCMSSIASDLAKELDVNLQDISYKIEIIDNDDITKISRAMHKQNDDWKNYEHSSIRAYLYGDCPKWLNVDPVTDRFGSTKEYYDFLLES